MALDDGPVGRLHKVVLDGPDPAALAGFWAAVLGMVVIYADDDWITLGPAAGEGTRLGIQRAPDHRPPVWPDPDRPQQLHLDVFVDDVAAAGARVEALGATRLDRADDDHNRVYADPAGHPFCLLVRRPENP